MKFSANLGFLWSDLSLPDAILAARDAGFDAVECHWPYSFDPSEVRAALKKTGLPMLGLNTRRGDVEKGDNGLSALPDRDQEARAAIDEAVEYARQISAQNIHVMAGFAHGEQARLTFIDNLYYACQKTLESNIGILIEPLNSHDAPGYFLNSCEQAVEIISTVDSPNLGMMFDCYHIQRLQGDLTSRLEKVMPYIRHIQFASVPDRGAPDQGEVDYGYVFRFLEGLGYTRPLGAEYRPSARTEDSLGWLDAYH